MRAGSDPDATDADAGNPTKDVVAGQGPLAGVRVLELAGIGPGPFGCMVMADLGADVIRLAAPRPTGVGTRQISGAVLNRSRVEATADLKTAEGLAFAQDLAARADVLVEGFRPGVAERLGIGPDVCLDRNPRLVYVRATGWGQEGPIAQTHGHDINYLAMAGTLNLLGRAGQPPTPPVNLLGDFGGGGMLVVIGALAGIHSAHVTGRGQVVDASILDGTALLSSMLHAMLANGHWSEQRGTNVFDTGAPFYDVYETSDGSWMAVAATSVPAFEALCEHLGIEADAGALATREAWSSLRAQIAVAFRSRTGADWTAVFDGSPACVSPVLSLAAALEHPHNVMRGTFVTVDGVTQAAPAPRFSGSPTALPQPLARDADALARALERWAASTLTPS